MSYETYKILHLVGVIILFFSLGGMALRALTPAAEPADGGDAPKPPGKALTGAFHGVALLVLLVSGFGALAKLGIGMGGWIHGKLLVWVILAASPVLLKRVPGAAKPLWFVLPLLGAAAAALAILKPGG